MSSNKSIFSCYVTGIILKPENMVESTKTDCIEYKVTFAGRELFFNFSDSIEDWIEDNEKDISANPYYELVNYIFLIVEPIRYILIGLILNNKWKPKGELLNKRKIQEIILNHDYPIYLSEKYDNLFIALNKLQEYDGEEFNLLNKCMQKYNIHKSQLKYIFYFKEERELQFYMNALLEEGYIRVNNNNNWATSYNHFITYKGLNQLLKLNDIGKNSNNCFVAMSFDETEYPIYKEAIYPACEETGFNAKRIDYEKYESDKTINDAMIALIKGCKFIISDFTKQKHNVYFETGYALGRNMKVIYTCRKDHFKEVQFDINHFPHIIYQTTEELRAKLIDRIKADILP